MPFEPTPEPGLPGVLSAPLAPYVDALMQPGEQNLPPEEIGEVLTNLDVPPPTRPGPEVTFGQQIDAAQLLENVAVSAARRIGEPAEIAERRLTTDEIEKLLRPGEDIRAFVDAETIGDMGLIRARAAREQEARRLLGEGPLPELAAIALAVMSDPTSYLTVVGLLGKGGAAARALKTALATAGEVALSEAALQASQETRTIEESAAAILTGAAFGAGLGGLAGALATRGALEDFRQLTAEAQSDIVAMGRLADPSLPQPRAAGAAAVASDPELTNLAGSLKAAEGLEKLKKVGLAAPSLELSLSRFAASRQAVLDLTDTGFITKGNTQFITHGSPLEVNIRSHNSVAAQAIRDFRAAYAEHRRLAKEAGQRPLSRRKFHEAVSHSGRFGDADLGVPGAGKTAARIRESVFEPYKREAQSLGLLPEKVDVKTAISYFTRVFSKRIIRAKQSQFRDVVIGWLRRTIDERKLEADAELGQIADSIIDDILGAPPGRIHILSIPGVRGPLKERTFNIPDELVEGFLENDALEVTLRHIRTMAGDIETMKKFGTLDPAAEINRKIQDEANALLQNPKLSERQRLKIGKEMKDQQRLVSELMNNIRGVNTVPTDPRMAGLQALGVIARNFNFTRLLGGVLLSSLPDLGKIVMGEGLARTFGRTMVDLAQGFQGIRMAKGELQTAGGALDLVLNSRIQAIFDVGENVATANALEAAQRLSQGAATIFARATLINHWNTALKSITSMMVSSRILGEARKLAEGRALSAGDIRRLARVDLNQEMLGRIAAQAEHWTEHGNVITANTRAWTDPEAVEAFRRALLRDVDNTIITPFAGDAPIWTSKEWGKSIFQFKKFASASTQRILISGLQHRDMATANGLMLMFGLGFLGTALRDMTARGEVRERSPRQWAVDSVDRSGAFSLFFELNAMSEKFLGVSPTSVFTGREVSRFAGRGALSQALGPTAGLFEDTGLFLRDILKGEPTQATLRRGERLFPPGNLFYTRFIMEALNQASGLPETRRARRLDTTAPDVLE